MVLVAVQLSVMGSYLPPMLGKNSKSEMPPQTIISLPVHTAVWKDLCMGVDAVAVQLSVMGSYLPPVSNIPSGKFSPPQTIISLPVHTAVCRSRPRGALVVFVAVQLSVLGS
jgi:hypothetical protein